MGGQATGISGRDQASWPPSADNPRKIVPSRTDPKLTNNDAHTASAILIFCRWSRSDTCLRLDHCGTVCPIMVISLIASSRPCPQLFTHVENLHNHIGAIPLTARQDRAMNTVLESVAISSANEPPNFGRSHEELFLKSSRAKLPSVSSVRNPSPTRDEQHHSDSFCLSRTS
jgi:hypothetical protein